MTTFHVMVNLENYQAFQGVLPPDLISGKERVAVGSCDGEGAVLGAVSLTLIDYQYTIDWIYVNEQARRRGVGSALMSRVFSVITGTGEVFPVSVFFPASPQREELYWFFKSIPGMTVSYSHQRTQIMPEAIRSSKALHRKIKERKNWQNLFALPASLQKQVMSEMNRLGQYVVSDYDEWKALMIPELCRCAFTGDSVSGILLVSSFSKEFLRLSYLYSTNVATLAEGLLQAVKIMEHSFPEKGLVFEALTEESQKLTDKLFPEAEQTDIYEALWM